MEWPILVLGSLLTVLAGALAVVAARGWRRFGDGRMLLVTITFLVLSLAGLLSTITEYTGFADEAFAVEPGPLVLLVVAVGSLYGAFLRRRRPPEPPVHG